MTTKGLIAHGSRTHIVLLFSKFYEEEISFEHLKRLNPKVFRRESDCAREVLRLAVNGYIIQNGKSWQITNKGVSQLYRMARKGRRPVPVDKDGL